MFFQADGAVIARVIKVVFNKIVCQRFPDREVCGGYLGVIFEIFPVVVPSPVSVVVKSSWDIRTDQETFIDVLIDRRSPMLSKVSVLLGWKGLGSRC